VGKLFRFMALQPAPQGHEDKGKAADLAPRVKWMMRIGSAHFAS
jgi:hypothetical protein